MVCLQVLTFEHYKCSLHTGLTVFDKLKSYIAVTNLLKYIQNMAGAKSKGRRWLGGTDARGRTGSFGRMRRKSSIRGIIRRTCSITVDPGDVQGKCQMIYFLICTQAPEFVYHISGL